MVVGFSVEDYESQLDAALRPVIDAAKLVVTRTTTTKLVKLVVTLTTTPSWS